MRHITQNGIDLIKTVRGFLLEPFILPGWLLTIGSRPCCQTAWGFSAGINEAQAEESLPDAVIAERAVLAPD